MNEDVLTIFIKNLIKLRKSKNCSCKLLSEFLGRDSSYINKVELGKLIPSVKKMIAIADYFNIRFVDLFIDNN